MQTKQTDAVKNRKSLQGVVVKAAMKDTCTVSVERYVKHPVYEKFVKSSKKYLVHDVGNTAKIGDKVEIHETRPISKTKHFALSSILIAASDE